MREKLDNKYLVLAIATLTPIIGVAIYMLRYHVGITQISIASSEWNDEFFYFKQIEGMVNYGFPKGYFGYNESHALMGNLGGWSVAMLLPYVAIGKVFGWYYMTPIVANIILWIIGFAIFVLALRPTLVQQIVVSTVWLSFGINIRYIFTSAPETVVTTLFLIFAIAALKLYKNPQSKMWLIVADVTIFYLTLVRGYIILFIVIVMAMLFKNSKRVDSRILIQVAIALVAALGYVLIVHYGLAEYFTPDVSTDWLSNPKILIKNNILGFIESLGYVGQALILKSMRGSWYIIYYMLLPYLIYKCIKTKDWVYYSILFSWFVLLIAMWTIYNAKEGCRHLMACSLIYIMLAVYMNYQSFIKYVAIIVLIYTTWFSRDDFYNRIKPEDADIISSIEDGKVKLNEVMELTDNEWDNTIVFTLSTTFNELYAIPAGFGINCCTDEYVFNNYDNLNSKYISAKRDGEMNEFLAERCELVTSYGTTNIYKLH